VDIDLHVTCLLLL